MTAVIPHPTLNLDWITDHLAVGGSFGTVSVPRLASALSVRHIVDLRIEAADDELVLARHGIEFLHLPTPDGAAVDDAMLDAGVAWSLPRITRSERLYVHCEYGIGRSALLALCVLVECGDAPLDALVRLKRARPCVSPSPAQLTAFVRWVERTSPTRNVPTWDQLTAVAYRGS